MKLSSLCNRKNVLILCIIVILLYIISGFYNPLVLTRYDYTSSKVPEGFDGYRIVHISDFHCKEFGDGESDLIAMIRNAEPDLILFTGDSIDDEHSLDNYRDCPFADILTKIITLTKTCNGNFVIKMLQ